MENPLIQEWPGPYGGVPPFDKVKVEHFKPALEHAMAASLAEIERIATHPEPPTFANTLEAMERSGRTLDRVLAIYGVYGGTLRTKYVCRVHARRCCSPSSRAFSGPL